MSEYPRCPTCGHEFKALPRIDAMIAALGLVGELKRLLTILASARGRYLTIKEIVHILYDGREDGGPVDAEVTVRNHMLHLRGLLSDYGMQVEGMSGKSGGFRLWAIAHPETGNGGYQLIEARAA